jgi:ABC-type branched-subunit amino acid transport system permease subunit
MHISVRIVLLTVGAGLPAFLLSRVLWPPAPGSPEPSAGQLPWFLLLGILEALVFGLGVSFLVFGLPMLRRVGTRLGTSPWPVYLAIGWLLVSWWPHNHLHQTISPADLNALLGIEYGFHVSLYVVGLVLAWFFLGVLRQASNGPGRSTANRS